MSSLGPSRLREVRSKAGLARAAWREAQKSGRDADAAALAGLVADLKPASLIEMVAAYVLDDDLAPLDAEDQPADEDAFGRALANLDEARAQLARDLAGDEAALDAVLPRLVACSRHAIGTFGRELGRESRAVRAVWGRVVGELSARGPAAPVGGFSACFLRGVADRDRPLAEELLDEVLRMEALHHVLVQLQASVGLAGRATDRLIQAATLPTTPAWTFRWLALGGVTGPVAGGDLRQLLLAVAGREGGIGPALEVMQMRLHGLKQAGAEVGPDDQAAGVEIMDRVAFEDGEGKLDRGCTDVIAGCFVPGRHDDAARRICVRIREAVGAYKVRPWEVAHVIAAFGYSFPQVALNVFVAGDLQKPGKLNAWGRERHGPRGGILGRVDDEVMIAWAWQDPGVRFEALARVVQPWTGDAGTQATAGLDDEEPGDWSSIGLRLIREAQDPVAVLSVYQSRLRPSSWSGSFADALTCRVRLLDHLLRDPDERISAWAVLAREALLKEAARVRECEDAEARERDQRFEW